jgi:thymidylate kinase
VGWKTSFLYELHQAATGMLVPDLTIILHGTPHRTRGNDTFERQDDAFYTKVKNSILDMASNNKRYYIVNANQPEKVIAQHIFSYIQFRFKKYFNKLL